MILPMLAADAGGPGIISIVIQLGLLFAIMYFLLIRPQQKKAKQHQAKIEAVERGNEVVTGGGLIGRVTKVMDDVVEIELTNGVRVRSVKTMLSDVRQPGGPAANA